MYQNYFIASTAPCYLFPTCTIVSMYLLSLIFQTWFLNYIILTYIYLQYCHKLYFFTMLIKESKSPFSRKICHYYVKFYIAEDELPIKIKLVFILAHFFVFVRDIICIASKVFVRYANWLREMICICYSFCTRSKLYLLNIQYNLYVIEYFGL